MTTDKERDAGRDWTEYAAKNRNCKTPAQTVADRCKCGHPRHMVGCMWGCGCTLRGDEQADMGMELREIRHLRNANVRLTADLSAALAVIGKMQEQRDSMPDRVRALPRFRIGIDVRDETGTPKMLEHPTGHYVDYREVLNCCAADGLTPPAEHEHSDTKEWDRLCKAVPQLQAHDVEGAAQ